MEHPKEPEFPAQENFNYYLRKREASPKTIASCMTTCRLFFSLFPQTDLPNLKEFKRYLLKTYKSSTVNNRIYGINCYLDSLNLPAEDPLCNFRLSTVKEQQAPFLDNVISQEDYQRMKEGLKRDGNMLWYFVVRFLAATGVRVSELLQIKMEHLTLEYMDLYSKGGKIRRIYFPKILCREAMEWFHLQGVKTGFLFLNRRGKPLTPRGVGSQLKAFALRYGVSPETVYPHSFRHRFAKNFLGKFDDTSLLADLMGHDSIETTRIYLNRTSNEQRELIDKIVTW